MARHRKRKGSGGALSAAGLRPAVSWKKRWLENFQPRQVDAPWQALAPLLALAFFLRAAVALSGDFVIHPDEVMQYLEMAHLAVFGNGVINWEFFYGARSWLTPGMIAMILALCDAVGLGTPEYYVSIVKLCFCGLALAIPWGMYHYTRRMFTETAGRIALIAGVLWPELIGFAHKPMTEFIATALICGALGIAGRSRPALVAAGALFAAAAAVRMQYLPAAGLLALAFLAAVPLRSWPLFFAGAAAPLVAVGIVEWLTWGYPYASYIANFKVNLVLNPMRAGESPVWLPSAWLLAASAGGVLAAVAFWIENWRRSLPLWSAFAIVLVLHSLSSHKEYRFIYLAIVLWLIPASCLLSRLPAAAGQLQKTAAAILSVYSAAFLLNLTPGTVWLYKGFSHEKEGGVRFIRDQSEQFAAYRFLARQTDVQGVADLSELAYHRTPGYYYLHHKVPFYDQTSFSQQLQRGMKAEELVSHVIIEAGPAIAGFEQLAVFGEKQIVRSTATDGIRAWKDYSIYIVHKKLEEMVIKKAGLHIPPTPPLFEFAD